MSNYSTLKASINEHIRRNNNQEITGSVLNGVLRDMVDALGDGFKYGGIVVPSSVPSVTDHTIYFLAMTTGTYTNCGGLSVASNEVAIFKFNGAWTKDTLDIARKSDLESFKTTINNKVDANKSQIETALANEVTRAKAAELVLTTGLSSEVARATAKETEFNTRLSAMEGTEAQRQSAFNASQAERETAFNEAEAEREEAIESAISEMNETFATNEASRNSQTSTAISNAITTMNATFASKEAERDEATEYIRENAEDWQELSLKVNNFSNRVETKRILLEDSEGESISLEGVTENEKQFLHVSASSEGEAIVRGVAEPIVEYDATNKAYVDNALTSKADMDGHYDGMSVGAAENLIGKGNPYEGETFTQRVSGGSHAIEDGIAEIRKIKGNTIKTTINGETKLLNFLPNSISSKGRNLWNETWEGGAVNLDTGIIEANANYIRSKEYIPIVGNPTKLRVIKEAAKAMRVLFYDGSFKYLGYTSPATSEARNTINVTSGAKYVKFYYLGSTYNNNISLFYDLTLTDYEPYEVHEMPLHIDTIKDADGVAVFPNGLLSAGTAYDEITKTHAVKRIGVVNLGSLNWSKTTLSESDAFLTNGIASLVNKPSNNNVAVNAVCVKYAVYSRQGVIGQDKALTFVTSGNLYVMDSTYADAAAFKTAMNNVYLYYELATPKLIDFARELNLDYEVFTNGVEELKPLTDENGNPSTSPIIADIVYGIDYVNTIESNKARIEELERKVAALLAAINTTSTTSETE